VQIKVVRGCFFEKMYRLSSILWSEVLEGREVPQKSEFPFPLHLRDPFINQLPQDIRVVMHTLLDSFIRINHNVR